MIVANVKNVTKNQKQKKTKEASTKKAWLKTDLDRFERLALFHFQISINKLSVQLLMQV